MLRAGHDCTHYGRLGPPRRLGARSCMWDDDGHVTWSNEHPEGS
jgi:hypothetical protein